MLEPGEVNIAPSLAHNTPPTQTSILAEYAYQFTTDDPDGLEPVYTLLEGPFTMDLDAASGLLTWSVPITEQCRHAVRLQVYDRSGGFDELAYSIRLPGGGNPPTITSTPGYDATESVLYEYQVEATDPNGDPLTYHLDRAPAGMTIDEATGLIGWTPTGSQIGSHPVVMTVEDSGCAYTSQSWEISVVERPNTGPQITSQPPVAAWVGQVYTYPIEVTDAENDPITYTLVSAPAGVSLDAQTGSIDWTPADDQIGLHAIEVLVADDRGGESAQNWTVGVSEPGNALPEITSQPTTWTLAEENYLYDVAANDPDDDALSFALAAAPAGMSIDPATGQIQWTAQTGLYDIDVQMTDGRGGLAVQAYTLEVAAELTPVQVLLSITTRFIDPGDTTTITVSRQGGQPPFTLSLEVDGEPVSLDAQGRATITGQTPGTYYIILYYIYIILY